MNFLVDTAQMKAAERRCDERYISYSKMMENAGNAIAKRIIEEYKPCAAVILCGAGNNGGDGFVIASALAKRGFSVSVILTRGEPKTDCAREYFDKLPPGVLCDYSRNSGECQSLIRGADMVVECVFGTGFHGELPRDVREIFELANSEDCKAVRISADVPAGINSDNGGIAEGSFRPHRTFVLAALKRCVTVPECRDIHGDIELLDIGIPEDCFEEYLAVLTDDSFSRCLPRRFPTSHKGTFGRLLNIAGSLSYCGAAAMSTRAALRSGAGLCTLAAPISVVRAVCGAIPETTYLPLPETAAGFVGEAESAVAEVLPKMTAVAVGCGMGLSENTRKLTEYVVRNASCPIVIDADGINSISDNINVLKERTGRTILTPHPLEFSRISGISVAETQADRIGSARRFAAEYGVVVVLKGANTVVTDGERVFVNTSGNPALAKGGSGDVLCGIIGALAAQGLCPLKAAVSGVYCHGKAADLAAGEQEAACVLASDIIERLPRVLRQNG